VKGRGARAGRRPTPCAFIHSFIPKVTCDQTPPIAVVRHQQFLRPCHSSAVCLRTSCHSRVLEGPVLSSHKTKESIFLLFPEVQSSVLFARGILSHVNPIWIVTLYFIDTVLLLSFHPVPKHVLHVLLIPLPLTKNFHLSPFFK
jgi:hypothetical protein